MNNPTKLLIDLSYSQQGNTGIQQELRNIFFLLAKDKRIDLSSFFYSIGSYIKEFSSFENKENLDNASKVLFDSQILSLLIDGKGSYGSGQLFSYILSKLQQIFNIIFKNVYRLNSVDPSFKDVFYRKFLYQMLTYDQYKNLGEIKFYVTNLVENVMNYRTFISPSYVMPKLETKGFDVALFQFESPLRVSKDTQKIVRHYDLIQMKSPDLVHNSYYRAYRQWSNIKANIKQKSIFVTISETTKKELITNFPELENYTYTIPCVVSENFRRIVNYSLLPSSFNSLSLKYKQSEKVIKWIKNLSKPELGQKYFFFLASIEPRKNIITLMKAFNEIKGNDKIKLVMAGSLGPYANSETMKWFNKLIATGDLIFLENPATSDLNILYSHASAFVFPSVKEGFGLPPVEAMRCGCPVISSDTEIHREVQEDASFYFKPYDYEALKSLLLLIINNSESKEVSEKVNKGYLVADKYTLNKNMEKWYELLNKIQNDKRK